MRTEIHHQDELEPVNCEECGSSNVLTAPLTCKSCEWWRWLMNHPHATERPTDG